MNVAEVKAYIADTYQVEAEYPWQTTPEHFVFRHRTNQKWFALVMKIQKNKVGLDSDALFDVMNLKLDPELISHLVGKPGYFRAYHMNKLQWITVALDGSVSRHDIENLLEMSYGLTKTKKKRIAKNHKEL